MGCCSMTQRNTAGIDEVGPDEIELLELTGEYSGLWNVGGPRLQLVESGKHEPPPREPPVPHQEQQMVLWGRTRDELHHRIYSHQPIKDWEGQPAQTYGEIAYSSLVTLYDTCTQERSEHFLVLFSFHLLILSVDHFQQDFVYEGILPLSGLTFRPLSWDSDTSHSLDGFEVSSPMVDSKVFICPSAVEVGTWMDHLESTPRPLPPAQGPLSYLLPCDEHWKREKLKKFLLQTVIRGWEGSPIQRMGEPAFISIVRIMNTHRQGVAERLMVLYPQDVLLLSVDNNRISITYEGRVARRTVQVVDRSVITGRLEFELRGDLVEPLQMSCTCLQDLNTWLFHLKPPKKASPEWGTHHYKGPLPSLPKLPRHEKKCQDVMIKTDHRCHHPRGNPVDNSMHNSRVF
ncbi:pleckstrin homology domain-containing family N member 1 [Gadus chalcogrammus]|uniref:pleckstrin homology domain-containing family N member 1 n=1 Tax=Gadus chalcogrammus TaxID=1042646 RepID=UPI0024C4B34E|nr:pleckstrin homology domain-containing family N member 1 [Gadus chalcogrammus]